MNSGSTEELHEADALRVRILNVALLVGVAVGGMAFVRALVDAIELKAWSIVGVTVFVYGFLIVLLLARRVRYAVRAFGFLVVMFIAGAFGLVATGYLPAPILLLVSQNVLTSVFFGRRATWIAFGLNLLAFLFAGLLLSSGAATMEATFYDPTDLIDWLRVTAMFAVFAGMAIVSVDVLTRHLDQSLQEQEELVENLKGAMQLHDEAERHRREAENRLREATGRVKLERASTPPSGVEARLSSIAKKADAIRGGAIPPSEIEALATDIARLARDDEDDRPDLPGSPNTNS